MIHDMWGCVWSCPLCCDFCDEMFFYLTGGKKIELTCFFSFSHSEREASVKQRLGELLWCGLASPPSVPGTQKNDCFLHACMNLVQIFPQRCPATLLHYTSHMLVPSAHHSTPAYLSSSLHLFCVEQILHLAKDVISLISSGFHLVSFFSSETKHERSDTAGISGISGRTRKTHIQDPDQLSCSHMQSLLPVLCLQHHTFP